MIQRASRRTYVAFYFACLPLALTGCSDRPPESDRVWLDLAEEVWHQSGNVTTDLISAPRKAGLDNLGYGWIQVHPDDPTRATLEMNQQIARLFLFSADGDAEALEIEISAVGKGPLKQVPLTLLLNGEPLTGLPLTRKWRRHRVEIPSDIVRQGRNLVEFRFPPPTKSPRWPHRLRPRVRSLEVFSANGRRLWSERPTSISLVSDPGSSPDRSEIRMPSPGWLEAVTDLPERARLRASFRVQRPPGAGNEPVLVYGRLLDQRLDEHHLAQERFTDSDKNHDFDVDLSAWQGQSVRLRLGVGGSGNAVVTWHWAVIEGPTGQTHRDEIEPIRRLQAPSSGRLGRPDVLVVLLDAARADAFSPFGGARPTPAVQRLAADGTVFETALAPSSWTGQSVSSILTGFFPDTLSVGPWGSHLPSGIETLAEQLTRVGYRTVLWTQHPFYKQQADLKRGFQEIYRPAFQDYSTLPSSGQLMSDQGPTFAFVHLMPPHAPYTPPPPYRGSYGSWYTGPVEPKATLLNRLSNRRDLGGLTEDDRRYVRDRYDENVAFADAQVGTLLSMLDSAGRYDSTLVILLSDHGEAFLEHGRYLHTRTLHREMLHVPLVVKWPVAVTDFRAEVAESVSLVDLVPTLVDGLAIPESQGGFQGRSMLPVVFDSTSRQEPLWATTRGVASYQQPPRPQQMFQAGPWKLLFDPLTEKSQLYQIERDPAETQDLAGELPLRTLLLRQALQRQTIFNRNLLLGASFPGPIEPLDTEIKEQLEALGYVN